MANSKIKEAALRQRKGAENTGNVNTTSQKVMTFYIDQQVYGLEVPNVIEIIDVQPFTKIPGIPEYIKGVINVRSKVVPVMEMHARFDKPPVKYTDRTCIIIAIYNDYTVGLIVDSVKGVTDVNATNISATPDHTEVNTSKFIKYIIREKDNVTLVLDVEKLLDDNVDEY